ncbi:lipopolysaccharide-induced tnf-alpha factor [Plakobranchus ocellatus]|uniref:Lipopolysaccharide-induced tnf-alpha factor n=1 Tax=Plakobranchus ocellatus TaxID=259542 RepID=A0AAV4C2F2_9GAST|nr:lipopolysaccharide-induced tnf-alpha factor [Plakobranchus ocellatus]
MRECSWLLIMSNYPAEPPPPYPGANSGVDSTYPPPNAAAYTAPYDYSKGLSDETRPQQYYSWENSHSGYSNPAQPGGGYSQTGYSQSGSGYTGGYTHATTVVVAQPAVRAMQTFRDAPVHCSCPHCRAEIVTGTHFETGTFTWVVCCVLWLVGCSLGCCFIPFCVDGCKDVIHTCPNCHQQIARYSRM